LRDGADDGLTTLVHGDMLNSVIHAGEIDYADRSDEIKAEYIAIATVTKSSYECATVAPRLPPMPQRPRKPARKRR
jgi:hypothetical protein